MSKDAIENITFWNHRAAQQMEKKGGGFAAALAQAYFRADLGNQARLLGAFAEIFEKHRALAMEEHAERALPE